MLQQGGGRPRSLLQVLRAEVPLAAVGRAGAPWDGMKERNMPEGHPQQGEDSGLRLQQ